MSDQEFVSTLASIVCCPVNDAGCEESRFCETLKQTPRNFSFQSAVQFCSWFESAGCSTLARDIKRFMAAAPQCRIFSEECERAVSEYEKSKGVSLRERCMGMSAGDTEEISTFCRGVQTGQGTPPPPPPGDSSGIGWLGGGAIATGAATLILYIKRFIRIIGEIGKEAEAANENIGLATKALRALNRESKAFLKEVRNFFSGPVYEFGKTLKYIFTLKWITDKNKKPRTPKQDEGPVQTQAAGAGEAKAENPRQTSPDLRPVVPDADPIRGKPLRSVVLTQLESLKDDAAYGQAGQLFDVQKEYVQLYLSELAINRWHALTPEARGEYLKNDTLPLRGALPNEFIRWFAMKYVREEVIAQVHTSSKEWAKEISKEIAAGVVPMVYNVQNQILAAKFFGTGEQTAQHAAEMAIDIWRKTDRTAQAMLVDVTRPPNGGDLPAKFIAALPQKIDMRRLAQSISFHIRPRLDSVTEQLVKDTRLSVPTSQYLARMVIEKWLELDETSRANFVEPGRTLLGGELPMLFMRRFKKDANLRDAGKLAVVYERLVTIRPELKRYSFSIINARVTVLYEAWRELPAGIKAQFGEADQRAVIPTSFVELMRTSLRVGTMQRGRIEPSREPWRYDAEDSSIEYEGYDLSLVMKLLVQENDELASYPTVLTVRAQALVDDWKNLPDNIKRAFLDHDAKMGNGNGDTEVSVLYMKLWQRLNGGIGVNDRNPVTPNGNGGTNGNGGGVKVSGLLPADESSGPFSSSSERSTAPVRNTVVTGATMMRAVRPQPVVFRPPTMFRMLPLSFANAF